MRNYKVKWCQEPVNIPGINPSDYESETAFQTCCADWLRKQFELTHKEGFSFWHHSANERSNAREGFRAKMMGQSKGYPDFVQHGLKLALELKVLGKAPSAEQLAWLSYFETLGYEAQVVYSLERFKEIVLSRI